MFEKQKMDVTDRVTAKFHDGGMKLYVDKQPIGEVVTEQAAMNTALKKGIRKKIISSTNIRMYKSKVKRKNIQTATKKQDGAKQWQLPLFFLFYGNNMA